MVNEADRKANNSKSAGYCRKYWGTGYSQNNTMQCDEYPFQSTYQGSAMGGAGTSHFSVQVIPTDQNRAGGAELNDFYNAQRILDQDKFYVDVLTADGNPYGQEDAEPTGTIAPVTSRTPPCPDRPRNYARHIRRSVALSRPSWPTPSGATTDRATSFCPSTTGSATYT